MVQKALGVMNSAVTKGCLESTDHFPCKSQAVPSCPPHHTAFTFITTDRVGRMSYRPPLGPVRTMVPFPFPLPPWLKSRMTNKANLPHSGTLVRVPRAKFLLFY